MPANIIYIGLLLSVVINVTICQYLLQDDPHFDKKNIYVARFYDDPTPKQKAIIEKCYWDWKYNKISTQPLFIMPSQRLIKRESLNLEDIEYIPHSYSANELKICKFASNGSIFWNKNKETFLEYKKRIGFRVEWICKWSKVINEDWNNLLLCKPKNCYNDYLGKLLIVRPINQRNSLVRKMVLCSQEEDKTNMTEYFSSDKQCQTVLNFYRSRKYSPGDGIDDRDEFCNLTKLVHNQRLYK